MIICVFKRSERKLNELIETHIEMDSVNWRGETIRLKNVRGLQIAKTGQVYVYPADVSKAEIAQLAEEYNLLPRDVALLLMIYSKPGPFKEGEVLYKYHLNKLLFYQWKELDNAGLHEALPHDEFDPAPRGPVPRNLSEDLERLQKRGLIETVYERWGPESKQQSMRTVLTKNGFEIAENLWEKISPSFKEVTLKIKERIFPLDPVTVRHRVHREFPEYRLTYTEPDRE